MATASRANYDVYLGVWTNWSQGKYQGATLTLTRQDGAFLVSFIAIFVALSGKSFWRICCFIIHRCSSTTMPQDALHHQRQAILRNADTPEDGAWRLFRALFAWRRHAHRPFIRLLPSALLAALTFVALLVGGIFSSRITADEGSEVLLTGKDCGPVINFDTNSTAGMLAYSRLLSQRCISYSNYATQCYSNNTNSEDCHIYVKPRIATSVIRNATCPFAQEMCKTQDGNIIIDTGLIDSHDDLGMNMKEEQRIQLRLVYHCAPIVSEGFGKTVKLSNDSTVPEIQQYFYGNITRRFGNGSTELASDFTFQTWKNYTTRELPGFSSASSDRPEYGVTSIMGTTWYENRAAYYPIELLSRKDATIFLIFLNAQSVTFLEPVEDPWFSAHRKDIATFTTQGGRIGKEVYLSDEPASAVGCTYRAQWCNPNLPADTGCEPLGPISDSSKWSPGLWSKDQLDVLDWFVGTSQQESFDPSIIINEIGTSALTARYDLSAGRSTGLPNNQWQIEIEHLVATALASMQGTFVESASGPRTEELKPFQVTPEDATNNRLGRNICSNQKIRSTLYSSFAVIPLAIVIILGTILITLDIVLEPLLNAYHRYRAKNLPLYQVSRSAHSRLEWRTMSVLQLQRLAHEGVGSGTWSRMTSENPITEEFQKLGMLDIRDRQQPLLRSNTDELVKWFSKERIPETCNPP